MEEGPEGDYEKIIAAFNFPMTVKAVTEDVTDFSKEAADAKALTAAINDAVGKGKKIQVEAFSLRLYEGELCCETGFECSGSG